MCKISIDTQDNKTDKIQTKLNKILTDRKALYNLVSLCRKWREDYDRWNLLMDEDSEESDELCGSWYDHARQAVYLSYAIKHNQTQMPPCAICGHSMKLGILSRWHDDGDGNDEYLDDARIIGTCSNMKCDNEMIETYLDMFDEKNM